MKHLLLAPMIFALVGAFVMAGLAAYQLLGISGRIDSSKFGLGPSWRWFAFDVGAYAYMSCLFAFILHAWLTL